MPGVVSLHDHSETQHKPGYFRGQCWGAIGLVVGTLEACFCLPLALRIHQGFRHLGQAEPGSGPDPTSPSGSCRWPCSSLWARMPPPFWY